MNIITTGEYRFQILEVQEHLSYLTGRVRMLDDVDCANRYPPVLGLARTKSGVCRNHRFCCRPLHYNNATQGCYSTWVNNSRGIIITLVSELRTWEYILKGNIVQWQIKFLRNMVLQIITYLKVIII